MTWTGFLAVGLGGALGCWSRWLLGLALNPWFPSIMLGTLAANLIGGYLVGVAIECFIRLGEVPQEWRLFISVGFLGGLTTFSAFSGEAVELLRHRELGWGMLLIALHLLGSLGMTVLGMLTVKTLHG